MGLSQLLAVGRSVRTIKDGPARYKMTQQHLLPKFGGAKTAESAVAGNVSQPAEAVSEPVRVEPAVKTVSVEEIGAGKSESGPAKAAAFVEATKKLRPFGDWSLFKIPFAWATARKKESGPMQTELSLDSVKPMRNDLSDSDFELARAPRRTVTPQATPTEPIAVPALSSAANGGLWRRLKTRLFRADSTN